MQADWNLSEVNADSPLVRATLDEVQDHCLHENVVVLTRLLNVVDFARAHAASPSSRDTTINCALHHSAALTYVLADFTTVSSKLSQLQQERR